MCLHCKKNVGGSTSQCLEGERGGGGGGGGVKVSTCGSPRSKSPRVDVGKKSLACLSVGFPPHYLLCHKSQGRSPSAEFRCQSCHQVSSAATKLQLSLQPIFEGLSAI